ncbi:glycosyltransferase family 4 protein [Arthrobacter sp. PAMC25564]|uniref:glycosyltransferase family 4 protein n=1 Tax=Arthrobacter sp. PAMC25564 TaxID=2565366 RepID=UPI001445B42F|nr:glycosyltransferase family 4 protein [Arthrobacter sp. PAMC25564]
MRIAVCTLTGAPDDVRVWSGTPAHFLEGLRAVHDEVVTIGPLAPTAYKALNKFAGLTGKLGRKVNWEVEPAALRFFTKAFDREVARVKPDVVIVLGWYPLRSASGIPIIYWGDATIGQRLNQSPHWSGLSARTSKQAEPLEAEALRELAGVMMPSRWALDDTKSRYGITRAFIAPFGSNVKDPGHISRVAPEGVRLLTMGVKWHRKGMDKAVETVDALQARGISAHLDVVGVNPPSADWNREYVTYHGFMAKATDADREKLGAMYRNADVFLLPTRNDPFPMVLAEAAAYSLPVVASTVGGVPDRVESGMAGILLDPEATPDAYADAVRSVLNPDTYTAMSTSARARYETDFTWESCARRVIKACRAVLPVGVQ